MPPRKQPTKAEQKKADEPTVMADKPHQPEPVKKASAGTYIVTATCAKGSDGKVKDQGEEIELDAEAADRLLRLGCVKEA